MADGRDRVDASLLEFGAFHWEDGPSLSKRDTESPVVISSSHELVFHASGSSGCSESSHRNLVLHLTIPALWSISPTQHGRLPTWLYIRTCGTTRMFQFPGPGRYASGQGFQSSDR